MIYMSIHMTKRNKQRQRQQRSTWAMNEFETLEQHQNSIKEFNERTRLEFEDFIQKQGSDRNKLQLRCTPFTEKKGGYGSFDLDFGLQIWRHQQSKADELDRIIALRDQQLIEQGQRFNTQSQQIASLKKQLERLGYTDNSAMLVTPSENSNKSGVRVITPSGESYVCAWDLASKDGEE